ncbi:MAG TPA: hypothetical protein VKI61_08200 [Chitinophagaceae bacterium]|jgi:hypothetical protein|nr:hypothetical protein [Chitinophagaceae bacterium]
MKRITTCTLAALMMLLFSGLHAQRISILEGDLSPLKGEKNINTEFTYENMAVGKFKTEAEYVDKKKDEYNKKEPGKGDKWAQAWVEDRQGNFDRKFNDLFEKHSDIVVTSARKDAKYTLIYKTTYIEPGYNIYVTRKNAETDAEVWIVETANPSRVIAKLEVKHAKGRTFGGNDYASGERIGECYADAGKYLGKFIKDKIH